MRVCVRVCVCVCVCVSVCAHFDDLQLQMSAMYQSRLQCLEPERLSKPVPVRVCAFESKKTSHVLDIIVDNL